MKIAAALAAAVFAAVILINPKDVSAAVVEGISGCLDVVIPALFVFTVLAVYLQQSGLYRTVLKPFSLPLSRLLKLPEELCCVFLLSNIGGYPVGAKLLHELVKSGRLSRKNAEKMLCFCYGSGPTFVIGTAGREVFGSAAAGGIIYAACFLSQLILAVVICRGKEPITLTETKKTANLSAECFIHSVDMGARVMYSMSIMSVLFSGVKAVLDTLGINALAERLLSLAGLGDNSSFVFPAFLEITRVRYLLPQGILSAVLCGGLLSFGGICVILQLAAVSRGEFSLKRLLISRIPAALISGVLSIPAGLVAPVREVYSPNIPKVEIFSVNMGMSVCLLIMSGIVILTAQRQKN